MARPSRWNSPTEAIRIPAHAVDAVLALARQLDQGFVQNEEPPESSPFIVSVGEDRYLITPPSAPAEVWEQADQLIDQLFSQLTPDQLLLLLGEAAQRWGKPINS